MTQMEEAERTLRRMILDMEVGPGERLTERWIEQRLQTSRTSVRTALFRLEAEGLVIRGTGGWTVAPIDLDEIAQLFIYREILELAAVRLGGRSVDEEMLSDFEELLSSVQKDGSPEQINEIACEFHRRIAGLANNTFISRGVADAMQRLQRARWLENDPLHNGWNEHRAIVNALRSGQVEHAAKLLGDHIREARERQLLNLERNRRSLRARGLTVTLSQIKKVP